MIASLANDLLAIAGSNALLLLAMCAVTSLILGLGLTTTACYIFLAILVGPALEKVGLNKMAVHMFIFYWGMLSSITPPVAIASFAAAGIAGAPAMKTGWESMWVGSIIYFLPFFFVANPALVLQAAVPGGPVPYFEALYLMVTAMIGTLFICGGIQGYQAGVGDLRARRRPGMAAAGAAGHRRPRAGHAGRRHHAVQQRDDGDRRRRHPRADGDRRAAARAARPSGRMSGPLDQPASGRHHRPHKERRAYRRRGQGADVTGSRASAPPDCRSSDRRRGGVDGMPRCAQLPAC